MGHRWHATTTVQRVRELRERFGLEVRVFGDLEASPRGPTSPKPATPTRPAAPPIAVPTRDQAWRPHDRSRTRVEARVAFPSLEEPEEIPTPTRRFTLLGITSGLPEDSREKDERQEERQMGDLRGRVKVAMSVVARTPGLAQILAKDWRKAARFYVRFGVTEEMFRCGGSRDAPTGQGVTDAFCRPVSSLTEAGDRRR